MNSQRKKRNARLCLENDAVRERFPSIAFDIEQRVTQSCATR
jgi:hypothetical protein